MATYTPNIDLKKPAQSDKIRIADLNGNADNIDAALGADFGVSNKPSVDDAVNSLGAGLAIISNGDIHAAITAGQYVYVRGHGTLTEGLYVATANVSQNGALTGSNVDAVSGGGLNALNSNLGNHIIKSFTLQSIAVTDGSPSSPSSITLDLSSYVPTGYTIYNAIVSVKSGNSWYNLPNFDNSASKYLILERVGTNSLILKNTDTGWGTTNITVTIFCRT